MHGRRRTNVFSEARGRFEGNECGLLMGMAQGVDGNEDSPAEGEKSWKRKKRLISASRLEVRKRQRKKAYVSLWKRERRPFKMGKRRGYGQFGPHMDLEGICGRETEGKLSRRRCRKKFRGRSAMPTNECRKHGNGEVSLPTSKQSVYSVCLHQRKSSSYSPGK